MTEKKLKVMRAAIKLFSEKGYHATSMQEIANNAEVSKGLLYKYFESKDSLLINVFKHNHDNMVERAKYIDIDATLTPKEKLKKIIEVEFEGVLHNEDYFNLLTKSLLIENNKHMQPFFKQVRSEMLDWHQEILLKVYGEEIRPIIWDMVMVLQGMLKEYVSFIMQEKQYLSSEDVSNIIVDNMDAVIQIRKGKSPVISDVHMEHCMLKTNQELLTIHEQLKQIITKLKHVVRVKKPCTVNHKDVYHTIQLFEKEIEQETPRFFLLKALFYFLDEHLIESEEVAFLGNLLDELDE
ncbi:Fatty acid metabolism regulator protein [Paraliobacillus sp. PM-2]|uniref:TetR/AcrR family transcriptional regulator n=1 Tax=Paraliobacillus sp. PM-2 TaxID=1462524 RepID=UPI00061BC1B7|nr:TetR/AcrR family transcriptional regulator [Paraliobacillus sp. PM-2]CQR48357.1 Fatty acid metabolism regulator protein [Paraliobacillus sp. PM-2]